MQPSAGQVPLPLAFRQHALTLFSSPVPLRLAGAGGGAGHLPPKCLHVPGLLRAQVPRPATATPLAKPHLVHS